MVPLSIIYLIQPGAKECHFDLMTTYNKYLFNIIWIYKTNRNCRIRCVIGLGTGIILGWARAEVISCTKELIRLQDFFPSLSFWITNYWSFCWLIQIKRNLIIHIPSPLTKLWVLEDTIGREVPSRKIILESEPRTESLIKKRNRPLETNLSVTTQSGLS